MDIATAGQLWQSPALVNLPALQMACSALAR
jgi:hypothetical protein